GDGTDAGERRHRLRATEALSRGTLALTMPRAPKARLPVRKESGAPAPTRKTAGPRGDLPAAADLKRTVVIEAIAPAVDGGRYPVKREVGAVFEVRSEEHTSELQSRGHLVCRLLLEKKKKTKILCNK